MSKLSLKKLNKLVNPNRDSEMIFDQDIKDPLHVICVISNTQRYNSRYKLYKNFEKHMKCSGATLYTVELAFGDRPFAITEPNNPQHFQIRSLDEVWFKESMINYAASRLPPDWKYMAWIDADVAFTRPNWVQETLQALQHYHVVQLFSHATDLGPNFEPMNTWTSFMYKYHESLKSGAPIIPYATKKSYYGYPMGTDIWHPGFAWATTREAFNMFGRLIDFAAVGSADYHMAAGLVGKIEKTIHAPGKLKVYKEKLLGWQERAVRNVQMDVGYLPGTIHHYWHGKKVNRKYLDRWDILVRNDFDPNVDLSTNDSGIINLTGNKPRLRDQLRMYFQQRNEDSVDV
jgi:hypothetical protein